VLLLTGLPLVGVWVFELNCSRDFAGANRTKRTPERLENGNGVHNRWACLRYVILTRMTRRKNDIIGDCRDGTEVRTSDYTKEGIQFAPSRFHWVLTQVRLSKSSECMTYMFWTLGLISKITFSGLLQWLWSFVPLFSSFVPLTRIIMFLI
jgi:hypothetical protein